MTAISLYVRQRLTTPVPEGLNVVAGSTPVLSFGSPATATVATLGLNPSVGEFRDKNGPLRGEKARLVDLEALGLSSLTDADEDALRAVVNGCDQYFERNPYWKWFRTLELLLNELGASYVDGSACHLDLVQWATEPVWNGLTPKQRTALISADASFLREQLARENVSLVLMNGRTVLREVDSALVPLTRCGTVSASGVTAELYRGLLHGTRFFGWSCNLQGTPGANSKLMRDQLVEAYRRLAATTTEEGSAHVTQIEKGHVVTSKTELAALLRSWFRSTNEPTLGDVGKYGGSAWLYIELPSVTAVLNADTKRSAVEAYLRAVNELGEELPWQVIANQSGKVNKVVYGDGAAVPGWYCYSLSELDAPIGV